MSAASDLLHDLAEHGVTVWQEAGQIRYRAPAGAMTSVILANIRQSKPELLALLAANDSGLPATPRAPMRVRESGGDDQGLSARIAQACVREIGAGPLVLTFELDSGLATCIDPVSASLADAVADLRRQFPERVGRVWQHGVEVTA